ncbi:MAG: hypothetical protein EBW55_09960, partial [Betaproteobacteria bacterium]|nr:hypothetical protein [Betaproteobacteria bacterium]
MSVSVDALDDPAWVPVSPARYMPYSFARSHHVLIRAEDGRRLLVQYSEKTSKAGLNELYRVLEHDLVLQALPQDQLERDLAQAYARQDGSAPAEHPRQWGVLPRGDDLGRRT